MQTIAIADIMDKKFVGADELRRELTDILKRLPKEGEIVITQHGKPKGALVDINYFLELQELEEKIEDLDPKLIREINEGIAEAEVGKGISAEELYKKLGL